MLDSVGRLGHHVRRAFDQLCIDINPDVGPPWLDRLVRLQAEPGDAHMMKLALAGLEAVL
jgi:hypothetical protein